MTQKRYLTNLASEFHVLSALSRKGYDASLTLGNRKSVDITVVLEEGRAITIDVKAVAGKTIGSLAIANRVLPRIIL